MQKLLLAALIAETMLVAQDAIPQVQNAALATSEPFNVNSRYTIESVQVTGWRVNRLSDSLRNRIDSQTGQKLDHRRLELLALEIKRELHVPDVTLHVARGATPDHVAVTFEVPRSHQQEVDLHVSKFLYHSKQGWSGEGSATIREKGNAFTFGLVSDNDALLERYAGIQASVERPNVVPGRLGLRFNFASYHNQWNRSTLTQDSTQTYRTRQVYEPEATLALAGPLELDLGVRFSRYRLAAPGANTESSNAVVSTLRYHQRWGSDQDYVEKEAAASYGVTEATGVLASDTSYTRHTINAGYRARRGRNSVDIAFLAGRIVGVAPLFDRFVLGNASTLRGWNKFTLDPLGGSRVIHGSITLAHRWFQVFYDTGAIWDRGTDRSAKQSVGCGLKAERFQLAVAFPLISGHMTPVFYTGMNF